MKLKISTFCSNLFEEKNLFDFPIQYGGQKPEKNVFSHKYELKIA